MLRKLPTNVFLTRSAILRTGLNMLSELDEEALGKIIYHERSRSNSKALVAA